MSNPGRKRKAAEQKVSSDSNYEAITNHINHDEKNTADNTHNYNTRYNTRKTQHVVKVKARNKTNNNFPNQPYNRRRSNKGRYKNSPNNNNPISANNSIINEENNNKTTFTRKDIPMQDNAAPSRTRNYNRSNKSKNYSLNAGQPNVKNYPSLPIALDPTRLQPTGRLRNRTTLQPLGSQTPYNTTDYILSHAPNTDPSGSPDSTLPEISNWKGYGSMANSLNLINKTPNRRSSSNKRPARGRNNRNSRGNSRANSRKNAASPANSVVNGDDIDRWNARKASANKSPQPQPSQSLQPSNSNENINSTNNSNPSNTGKRTNYSNNNNNSNSRKNSSRKNRPNRRYHNSNKTKQFQNLKNSGGAPGNSSHTDGIVVTSAANLEPISTDNAAAMND
jgi:hypothetical protein